MGYNSAVIVLNDGLSSIEQDKDFGKRLAAAVNVKSCYGYRHASDVAAHGKHCIHVNAASVISTAHADIPQVLVIKQNTGWNLWQEMPEHCFHDLKALLGHHGYDIIKKPSKAAQ